MNNHTKQAGLALVVSAALFSASHAFAAPVEITIPDFAPLNNGFLGNGNPNAYGNFNQPGFGIAQEDNEVERVSGFQSFASQSWDLEGMVKQGNTLYLIGGYDFLNGQNGGRPGDLFIKVGGAQPNGLPSTSTGAVTNAAYNYSYALDLSVTPYNAGAYTPAGSFGATANLIDLNAASSLYTTTNDVFLSNPWKFGDSLTNPKDGLTAVGVSYTQNLTSAALQSALGVNYVGSFHNVLAVDLSFLSSVQPGSDIWYSYTMECGNDSLKGHERVPDGGASALLIGLGLGCIAFFKRSRRTA